MEEGEVEKEGEREEGEEKGYGTKSRRMCSKRTPDID